NTPSAAIRAARSDAVRLSFQDPAVMQELAVPGRGATEAVVQAACGNPAELIAGPLRIEILLDDLVPGLVTHVRLDVHANRGDESSDEVENCQWQAVRKVE